MRIDSSPGSSPPPLSPVEPISTSGSTEARLHRTDCCSLKMVLMGRSNTAPLVSPFSSMKQENLCPLCIRWEKEHYDSEGNLKQRPIG